MNYRSSLQARITIISLLILLVPSLIIGIVGYKLAESHLTVSGEKQLQNDVHFTIAMIHDLNVAVKSGALPLAQAQEMVKETILGKKDANGKRPISAKFDIGENGYLYIFDQKAVAIAHPFDEGKEMWETTSPDGVKAQQQLVKTAQAGGGYVEYQWPLPNDPNTTAPKIVYTELDPDWGWVVCAGAYRMDFDSGANQILDLLLVVLGVFLLFGTTMVVVFGRNISRPLVQLSQQAASVAAGDLTVEPVVVKNRDEVGRLASDFNTMVATLKQLVYQVRVNTEQIASSSEELTASAQQSSEASEHNAVTMQQLAEGTDKQVRTMEETDRTMKELATGIQQIATSAQSVAQTAMQASETAKGGDLIIQKAVAEMSQLGEDVGQLSHTMSGLGEQATNIGMIIESISAIAAQTNLLALNAAIEAARAGENGRGFAVVADEVRKLAEQSSELSGKISENITTIQSEIYGAVTAMKSNSTKMANGIEAVSVAGASFQEIRNAVDEVTEQIHDVSTAVQQMSAGADHVAQAVDAMKGITEIAAEGTQTVSASSEQQLASMQEITASSAALSQMAEELDRLISKFKF